MRGPWRAEVIMLYVEVSVGWQLACKVYQEHLSGLQLVVPPLADWVIVRKVAFRPVCCPHFWLFDKTKQHFLPFSGRGEGTLKI